jgi:hypothetical protein
VSRPPNQARLGTLISRGAKMRCPSCGRGRVFRSWFHMLPACDDCGYSYEREEGYWVGALIMNIAVAEACFACCVPQWCWRPCPTSRGPRSWGPRSLPTRSCPSSSTRIPRPCGWRWICTYIPRGPHATRELIPFAVLCREVLYPNLLTEKRGFFRLNTPPHVLPSMCRRPGLRRCRRIRGLR